MRPSLPRYQCIVGALALALCLAAAQPAAADHSPVYLKALQATGFVVVPKGGNQLGYGTCWIADQDNCLVVTNRHVVGDFDICCVAFPRFDNGELITQSGKYTATDFIKGKVVARDAKRDLALIKLDRLPAGASALQLAPNSISPGAKIWAVGNAGMAQKDLKNGTLWRERQGIVKNGFFWKTHLSNCDQKIEFRAIQTDSGSKPGDSGGPVVSEQGQLVGVNSCNNDKGDYAVDVNEVRLFLARWTPAPNLPPPPKGVAGTWTVSWKHKDQELCAGLTLNADGTGHWDGGKLCPGTYVYDQGKLTLQMPGSGVNATAPLVWESHNSFRFTVQFTDGAIEFVATRR